jgi:hypothetical protein
VADSPDNAGGQSAPEPLGADFIIPLLAIALTAYYLITTADLVWEAKATGVVVGTIVIAMCVFQVVRLARRIIVHQGTAGFGNLLVNDLNNRRRFALLALVVLFIATIEWAGTTLGLFLLLIGTMLVMGVREARTLLLVALVTSATVYVLLIYLLNTRLPRGVIEEQLGRLLGVES